MNWIFIALAVGIYIYRFISKSNAAAKLQAEKRKKLNEETGKSVVDSIPDKPKTLDEVLADVFKEVETKTNPYARPEKKRMEIPSPIAKKKTDIKNPAAQIKKIIPETKKQASPFLNFDFTPEVVEPEGTPAHLMEDYIKKHQLTDGFEFNRQVSVLKKNFNLRDAIIANVILSRPEWQ